MDPGGNKETNKKKPNKINPASRGTLKPIYWVCALFGVEDKMYSDKIYSFDFFLIISFMENIINNII